MRGLNQHYLEIILASALPGNWKDEDGTFSITLIDGQVHIELAPSRALTSDEREDAECVITEIIALLDDDVPWFFDVHDPP